MRLFALIRPVMLVGLVALAGCSSSPTTSQPATSTSNGDTPAASTQNAIERAFSPKPILISAGTPIVVTVDQSVSSKTNNSGDRFDASIAKPVMVDQTEVIPVGAKVSGRVVDAKSAGKFKGNAVLTVTLNSITVGGDTYDLKTSSVTEVSKGRGKRTAIGAGGGAVVGGLIGALAGGGKGAAIGAGAGAGAGTAGAAFTGNRDVGIAAETQLRFRLTAPLEVKGK